MRKELAVQNSIEPPWFILHTVGRYMDVPARLLDRRRVFGKIVPMLLQNVPFPSSEVQTATYPEHMVERVIPTHLRELILEETQNWNVDQAKGMIVTIGKKETGTSHPHLFELKRLSDGVRLLFVDPEDIVGRRNFFKPSVVHLGATVIRDDQPLYMDHITFRSEFLDRQNTHLPQQYLAAEQLADGGLPDFLKDNLQAILFHLSVRPDSSILQTRFLLPIGMNRFLRTGNGPIPLEYTADDLRVEVYERFPILLGDQDFEQRPYEAVVERANQLRAAV